MKITPLEVGSRRFPRKLRGYDPREVDIFLEMVTQEMDDLVQENRYLNEDVKRKSAELENFRENEALLREAMISARKMAAEMKDEMLKEAQAVVAQAELEADAILERARRRVLDYRRDIQDLKEDKARFQEELRSLLRTYEALLEAGMDPKDDGEDREPEADEAEEARVVRVVPGRLMGGLSE